MTDTTYLDYQPATRPPWHGGPDGRAWSEAMGVVKNSIAEGARRAVRQRWISVCEEDALALHGAYRGWPRMIRETVPQYRRRLSRWWTLAQLIGTPQGITTCYGILGLSNVTVYESFTASWGRSAGLAARQRWFWVVVRQPHPFGTDFNFRWGDGTLYGDGHVYGMNGDPSLFLAMRWIVQNMKSAHSYCPEVIVVLAGDVKTGTGATDGDPLNAGSRVTYLSPVTV